MAEQKADADDTSSTSYEPNFVMPNHNVIREDNWEEYKAKGFVPVVAGPELAAGIVGIENVYTGDPYDYEAGRPLRHNPAPSGAGRVYLSPEGAKHKQEVVAAQREIMRKLGLYGPDDPATN